MPGKEPAPCKQATEPSSASQHHNWGNAFRFLLIFSENTAMTSTLFDLSQFRRSQSCSSLMLICYYIYLLHITKAGKWLCIRKEHPHSIWIYEICKSGYLFGRYLKPRVRIMLMHKENNVLKKKERKWAFWYLVSAFLKSESKPKYVDVLAFFSLGAYSHSSFRKRKCLWHAAKL